MSTCDNHMYIKISWEGEGPCPLCMSYQSERRLNGRVQTATYILQNILVEFPEIEERTDIHRSKILEDIDRFLGIGEGRATPKSTHLLDHIAALEEVNIHCAQCCEPIPKSKAIKIWSGLRLCPKCYEKGMSNG